MNLSTFEYRSFHDGALGVEIAAGGEGPLSLSPVDVVAVLTYLEKTQPIQRIEFEAKDDSDEVRTLALALAHRPVVAIVDGRSPLAFMAGFVRRVFITDEAWLMIPCAELVYVLGSGNPKLAANLAQAYFVSAKPKDAYDFIRRQYQAGSRIPWRIWPRASSPAVRTDLITLDLKALTKGGR